MESTFAQILGTVVLRPYVFVFLLVYLFGCSLHLGLKRAVLFCVVGYLIAWLSEVSSINNGIPYGYYYYVGHTRGIELWLLGVPFMDSLSYVFLAYAGYTMALLIISPLCRAGAFIYLLETAKIRRSLYATVLGTIFFVYLDIIIDPVALQGDRWFLGRIYGYPDGGAYFGVPISNFAGWFVVGFLMIYALQNIDYFLRKSGVKDWSGGQPWRYLIGPGLYAGVLAFNLSVTFLIKEHTVGWAGVFIVLLPLLLVFSIIKIRLSAEAIDKAVEAHRKDFPEAIIPGF